MYKVTGILLLLVILSCAFKTGSKRAKEIDGIIYLDDSDSEAVKTKAQPEPPSSDRESQAQKPAEDPKNVSNLKEIDGIIYLEENQVDEVPVESRLPDQKLETGSASFYSLKFRGRRTASGEVYDPNQLTAAHRTLKFGTKVKITNLSNNQSVIVRINDRGPHVKSRIIDVSYSAAQKLGMIDKGIVQVAVEVVKNP